MKHVIYGLREPQGLIRYVGYTKDADERLAYHIFEAQKKVTCHRHKWIRKLLRENKKPELVILEYVKAKTWEVRERYWIQRLAMNHLVNSTCGGEGLINPSKALRRRIGRKVSLSLIGNQRRKGILHSEEVKKKISISLRNSKKFKKAIRNRRKARLTKKSRKAMGWSRNKHFSVSHRTAISKSLMGNKIWLGKKHKHSTRIKMSTKLLGNHRALGMRMPKTACEAIRQSKLGAKFILRGSNRKLLPAGKPLPRGWHFANSGSSSHMVA